MGCKTSAGAQPGQPFPRSNARTIRVNQPLPVALKEVQGRVFSYKLTTLSKMNGAFVQEGNAPNYQGDRITLCTCMHWHRTSITAEMWVAGFGGKSCGDDNELFYLMKVAAVCDNFAEMWNSNLLPNRDAKSASECVYGDVYVPKSSASGSPHDPASYETPLLGHRHRQTRKDRAWHKDIDLWRADPNKKRLRRQPDPRNTNSLLASLRDRFCGACQPIDTKVVTRGSSDLPSWSL